MRLTQTLRSEICQEILERKFKDQEETLKQKGQKLAKEFLQKELKGVPWRACKELIRMDPRVVFTQAKEGENARWGAEYELIQVEGLPCRELGDWVFRGEKASQHVKEAKDLLEARRRAGKDIRAVLSSVNTTKQLYELMPELEPIVSRICEESPNHELVPIETLERVRGLL